LVIDTKYVVVGIDTSYHQPVHHPLSGKRVASMKSNQLILYHE